LVSVCDVDRSRNDPSLGIELAEARLRRKLTEPIAGFPGNPPADGSTAELWEQSRFVATLAPFRADRLQATLLDLFRRAAAMATADLRTQPAGPWDPSVPSLGSDLVLVAPGKNLGAAKLVNRIQADECRKFLAELGEAEAPAANRAAESAHVSEPV